MNVSAVALYIKTHYSNLSDGITLYEIDGKVLFEIRNSRGESIGNYLVYLVRPPLNGEKYDPNISVSQNLEKQYLRYPVRIPDHSELGATKTGWQLRVKGMMDKALEDFREFIKKHEAGEQSVQIDSNGFTAGKYDPTREKR